jgi:hypothetical protein
MQVVRRTRNEAASWLVALSMLGVVPHTIDALTHRVPDRFGFTDVTQGAWFFGSVVALQLVAALANLQGRRWGTMVLGLVALGWVVGAIVNHPSALTPGGFAGELSSRIWIWAIVVFQGSAFLVAANSLRPGRIRPRRF